MNCPRCQHENPAGQKFCGECGTPLGSTQLALSYAEVSSALSEALEQQTATGEVLRVISGSRTDLQPVLDAVTKRAANLCQAFDASIFLLEDDRLVLVAHRGPIAVGPIGQFTLPLVRGTLGGRVVLERRTVHVRDLQQEGEEFPEGSSLARRFGHRTVVGVPLLREGVSIGCIQIRRAEVQPFTEKQVELLKTFADQAVIALENVRLFTELQARNREVTEALEQQTTTAEILRVISRSHTDVQPVFDTIVASAVRLCRAYLGAVFQFDGARLHFVAHHNFTPKMLDALVRLHPRPPQRDTVSGRPS